MKKSTNLIIGRTKGCLLLMIMLLAALGSAPAQVQVNQTSFPDDIFRQWISDNVDTNHDNVLSSEEIALKTEINLNNKGIINMKGLEVFKDVLTSLHLMNNYELTGFDLTPFTHLTYLDLENCYAWGSTIDLTGLSDLSRFWMTEVEVDNLILIGCSKLPWQYNNNKWKAKNVVFGNDNRTGELNVSNNDYVETIILSNMPNLEGLKVCSQTALKTLTVENMESLDLLYTEDDNALEDVSLSNLPMLSDLDMEDCWALKSFDLTPFSKLKRLDLDNCWLWTDIINLSGLTELEKFWMDGITVDVLNLTGCSKLPWGYNSRTWNAKNVIFGNDNRTGELELNDNPTLETVSFTNMSHLQRLNLNRIPNLKSVTLDNAPELEWMEIYKNDNLEELNLDGNLQALTTMKSYNDPMLKAFDLSKIPNLTWLDVEEDYSWGQTVNTGLLPNLGVFYVGFSKFLFLDLSNNMSNLDVRNLFGQTPTFPAVLLSATEVGVAVDDAFDASRVENLTTAGGNPQPSTVTVDGQKYFVFLNSADDANMENPWLTYLYNTGLNNKKLEVSALYTGLEKCRSFLTLSKDKIWPTYGGTATAPTVTRSEGYDGALTYTSSNTSVVTVNSTTGKLTVKKAGTAIITVTGAETAYRQAPEPVTYTVTVKKASPVFTFAEPEIAIFIDEAMPQNALNKGVYDGTVTYASSNTAVATVNASTGAVTIKGAGTTTITASGAATSNCNAPTSASYTLTVSKHTATITLSKTTVNATYGGSAAAPTVTVTDGYDGTLNYTSNKTGVVTVNKTTGKLTIKGAGTATITVSGTETNTWNKPANKTYTVKVAKASPVFSFEQPFVEINNVYNMAAAENALSTGLYDGQVVFSSSDESVATVDPATGDVSFHHSGTVTITATGAATSNCNAATASYQVEVSVEATGVNAITANMEDGFWYTPAGIRVNDPRKGQIYIHNGKKVMYKAEAK